LPAAASASTSAGVGVLHELARVGRTDSGGEPRRVVYGVDGRQAFALGDLAVDLAERGGEVHDARAVLDAHELVGDDAERVPSTATSANGGS
jgi:hypothetical protein